MMNSVYYELYDAIQNRNPEKVKDYLARYPQKVNDPISEVRLINLFLF
jgi:hypothetical protein